MWRGVVAADGLPSGAIAFWNRTLGAATAADEWQAELAKKYWANTFLSGVQNMAFLDEERALMQAALGDLGLPPADKEKGKASA